MKSAFFSSDLVGIPNNLPPRPDSEEFTDRFTQIKELKEYIERPWRVVITGLGGIGKTTLALEGIYQLAELKKYDAIIWTSAKEYELDAAKITVRNPYTYKKKDIENKKEQGVWVQSFNDFLLKILEVSRHPNYENFLFDDIPPVLNEVISWLEIKHTILVIDDLDSWKFWAEYLDFVKILPNRCKVVITSRQVFNPDSLPGMALIRLHGLAEDDARNYLIKLLRKKQMDLDFSEINDLLDYSDGNPLIIGLAVTLVENKTNQFSLNNIFRKKLSIKQILKGLHNNQTGEFLIKNVFESLSDAAADTLVTLASLNNTLLTPISTNQLLHYLNLTSSEVDISLKELENSSLISHDINKPNQYVINDLVRDLIIQENRALAKKIDREIHLQRYR
jgi:hypothetical protein